MAVGQVIRRDPTGKSMKFVELTQVEAYADTKGTVGISLTEMTEDVCECLQSLQDAAMMANGYWTMHDFAPLVRAVTDRSMRMLEDFAMATQEHLGHVVMVRDSEQRLPAVGITVER